MKSLFVSGLLVLALLPATAEAEVAQLSPALESQYRSALQTWGHPDGPPGCVAVDRRVVAPEALPGAFGRATQPPPGAHLACLFEIRSDTRRCAYREAVLHEVGHLVGYPHSDDPRSIMYPSPTIGDHDCLTRKVSRWTALVKRLRRRCANLRRPRRRDHCRAELRRFWVPELRAYRAELRAAPAKTMP